MGNMYSVVKKLSYNNFFLYFVFKCIMEIVCVFYVFIYWGEESVIVCIDEIVYCFLN